MLQQLKFKQILAWNDGVFKNFLFLETAAI